MTLLSRRSLAILLACLAAPAADRARAQPAASPMTLDALNSLVTGMGYDTKPDNSGKHFTIPVHSNYNYIVDFFVSADGSTVWLSVNLASFNAEQLPRLQTVKLLEASDTGPSNFTLSKGTESDTLYVQRGLPSRAANAVNIRSTIDNLVKLGNDTEAIWNKSLWK